MFFKSATAYLNATHHGWAAKKIFNSRCSKKAIFQHFWSPLENPLKARPFQDATVFV